MIFEQLYKCVLWMCEHVSFSKCLWPLCGKKGKVQTHLTKRQLNRGIERGNRFAFSYCEALDLHIYHSAHLTYKSPLFELHCLDEWYGFSLKQTQLFHITVYVRPMYTDTKGEVVSGIRMGVKTLWDLGRIMERGSI